MVIVTKFSTAELVPAPDSGLAAGVGPTQGAIVPLLEAMLCAVDVETIWSHLCGYMRERGFGRILHGYSPNAIGPRPGARGDFLILSTLDRAVTGKIVDRGYYEHSLTFYWAMRNAGLCSWSVTPEAAGMPDFAPSQDALRFFHGRGIDAGCTIGFPATRTRGRAVMFLVADQGISQRQVDQHVARHANEIFVVATVAHRSLIGLPFPGHDRSLTSRQREVLELVAEGMTTAAVAEAMGLSMPTVEKHLRLARERLGCTSTAHALVKAAFLNQMFLAKSPPKTKGP